MKKKYFVKRSIKDLINEIKQRVSIEEVVSLYGISHGRCKTQYHCPFHGVDKRPSASIERKVFHCFTCNQSWDVVDFVAKIENMKKWDVVRLLDDRFNLGLFNPLSQEERSEILKRERERIKQQKMEIERNKFEKETLKKIVGEINYYNQLETQTHPTRRQVRENTWDKFKESQFFNSFKKRFWLEWLYARICGLEYEECEYDFIYQGLSKIDLLRKIYKKEIEIKKKGD